MSSPPPPLPPTSAAGGLFHVMARARAGGRPVLLAVTPLPPRCVPQQAGGSHGEGDVRRAEEASQGAEGAREEEPVLEGRNGMDGVGVESLEKNGEGGRSPRRGGTSMAAAALGARGGCSQLEESAMGPEKRGTRCGYLGMVCYSGLGKSGVGGGRHKILPKWTMDLRQCCFVLLVAVNEIPSP